MNINTAAMGQMVGQPTRETQVSKEMGLLFEAIECLSQNLNDLDGRLAPVRTQVTQTASDNKPPEQALCKIAQTIKDARGKIDGLIQCVSVILRELEI